MTDQRLDALERANHVRQTRKGLREAVARGQVNLYDILAWRDHDGLEEVIRKMPVGDLLRWSPKIGKVKSQRLCKAAMVSPTLAIGDVTDRQIAALGALLPFRPAGSPTSTE